MEDRVPLLKRADTFIFQKIDEFRATPSYAKLLENDVALEENEQRIAKGVLLAATAILPLLLLFILWLTNYSVKSNLELRTQVVNRMQEILSQNGAAGNLSNTLAASTSFSDQNALNSQMSSVLSGIGVDAGKVRISNFTASNISSTLTRAEADFKFEGLNTAQLMSMYTALMGRERFRVSSVAIKRNDASNLLDGTFHAIHFGQALSPEEI